jgi:hypothetical protein
LERISVTLPDAEMLHQLYVVEGKTIREIARLHVVEQPPSLRPWTMPVLCGVGRGDSEHRCRHGIATSSTNL